MDLLLLGGTGQVGTELCTLPLPSGVRVVAPARHQLDLGCARQIADWVSGRPWSAVINAAAYTDVDRAESDVAAAWYLNACVPARLAAATGRRDIPLLHISTDYVFDGRKGGPTRRRTRQLPSMPMGPARRPARRPSAARTRATSFSEPPGSTAHTAGTL
jgi:dTDP-4-dehydrorhamnose reductase